MGDRGNIKVVEEQGGVIYLYSHWGGSGLSELVQVVLTRRQRWKDESYLTRMFFSAMIDGEVNGDTGYGISTYQTDENHPDVEVHIADQKIVIDSQAWTFEEFVALDEIPL